MSMQIVRHSLSKTIRGIPLSSQHTLNAKQKCLIVRKNVRRSLFRTQSLVELDAKEFGFYRRSYQTKLSIIKVNLLLLLTFLSLSFIKILLNYG